MSDIENYSPDESPEQWKTWAEVSEKFKEATKKATAWVQRTQKDEKKSQKYDHILSTILIEIIRKKDFDALLAPLFDCVDAGYPSNFLVGIFSLIYHPAHEKIREVSKKEIFSFHHKVQETRIDFRDDLVSLELKDRINIWIEDIIDIIRIDPSSITTTRLKNLLPENQEVLIFITVIFQFFFSRLNIDITLDASKNYGLFIVWEIEKSLKNIPLEEI